MIVLTQRMFESPDAPLVHCDIQGAAVKGEVCKTVPIGAFEASVGPAARARP